MVFDFAQLMAHLAKTRELEAGSIIGSGTVSNKQGGLFGSSVANGGVGYCCIAELRMYETIEQGKPKTPFMRFGDRVRIEMRDAMAPASSAPSSSTVERYAARLTAAGSSLRISTSSRISSATDCGNPARAPSRLSSSRWRR
jgi:fumarylacetoacetate (FAA) hydrolase